MSLGVQYNWTQSSGLQYYGHGEGRVKLNLIDVSIFSLSKAMIRLARDGTPNPSRETNFSGANADREIFIFPVQLTTCRIGNLTRLIHTLAICVTIHR